MKLIANQIAKLLTLLVLSNIVFLSLATAQSLKLKGTIKGANGYTLALVFKDGSSKTQKLNSKGSFNFSGLKSKTLKNSSLQLIGTDGRYYGPVVLGRKGNKISINLSGKSPDNSKLLNLGKIILKTDYAIAPKSLRSAIYVSPKIQADSSGKPVGAGNAGIVSSASNSLKTNFITALETNNPGDDNDRDGIINSLDVDDNGNSILDSADPESAGSDVPYVSLNFDFRRTLNFNVRSGLSDSVIDSVVSGENAFASTFFISLPQDSTIDGGYLICGDALTYCRPNNPLGFSSGVSESSSAFRGPMSSLLNSSGHPVLERISVSGNPALVLSMQPRVGRSAFRSGDMYRVVLTSGANEVSSRTFSLPPYFISVPAIRDYTANSVTTTVDYSALNETSGTIPGVSPSNPIILGSDGLLNLNFWRPQREAVGSESGYQDFGALNYGVIIENAQATCAGFYSNTSGDLIEDTTPLGNGNSPLANQGANLNPLVDQSADRPASVSNLLSLSVDLKSCLARSGGTPGTYNVTLSAAGADLTGGRNTANQFMYVTIP